LLHFEVHKYVNVETRLYYIQQQRWWVMCIQPFRFDKLKINPNKETRNAAIMLKESALKTIITFNYGKFVCYSKFLENFPCIFYRSCVILNKIWNWVHILT
jgi:hypothetical protein